MVKHIKQMDVWEGNFGKNYTKRNLSSLKEMNAEYIKNFGISRSNINKRFLDGLDRSIRILEVGTNVGNKLVCLQQMGFTNLYGIELQQDAVEKAKTRTRHINIIQGSSFDIPFKDGFFDLVFTSGLLIHIPPNDLKDVFSEMVRVSRKYIWGMECFAPQYTAVQYHGKVNLFWKTDFVRIFLSDFKIFKCVKEEKFIYKNDGNVDMMYLLKRKH